MARPTKLHFVKRSRKSYVADNGDIVHKGVSYYWWKFNFTKYRHISLTKPDEERLYKFGKTEFQSNIDGWESAKTMWSDIVPEDEKDEMVGKVEEFSEELQERLGNMPDQLQESSVLNEYIEQLEEFVDELNSLSTE